MSGIGVLKAHSLIKGHGGHVELNCQSKALAVAGLGVRLPLVTTMPITHEKSLNVILPEIKISILYQCNTDMYSRLYVAW